MNVNIFKKYFNQTNYLSVTIAIILLQPLLDIDYLIHPFLEKFGLPLPSTVVYLIGYPVLVVFAFLLNDRNKKRTLIFGLMYLFILAIYFIVHHLTVVDMTELLYLPTTYKYTLSGELKYVLSLVLPLGLVYAFYQAKFSQEVFNRVVLISAISIALPLFVFNMLAIGPSTYYAGDTLANFPTWFFGVYESYNPKMLATKFYFSEGNTTGIILFSIFPLILTQFIKARNKLIYYFLIPIYSIAMWVLATRVATYGVLIMLLVIGFIWIFLVLLKKERIQIIPLTFLVIMITLSYLVLPYTPAVRNLEIDNRNDLKVSQNEGKIDEWKGSIDDEGLMPGSVEFNYYYQHIFEDYYWLLTISNEYYKLYYPYVMDPKFYVDLIFEVDFYDRVSGRQFQEIFFNYKWNQLNSSQRLLGFGYSRFMTGSILLEQDFIMQRYTLGWIGMVLLTFPWLGLLVVLMFYALRNFSDVFDLEIISPAISISAILGGAYLSGHVLDQYFSTTFLAFFIAFLMYQLTHIKDRKDY